MAATDFTKLPKQIIVDLINSDNSGAAMTTELLDFGLPTAATGQSPARNTELTVTAHAGSGYTGNVVLKYNRVDFAVVPGTRSNEFPVGNATNVSDLIPEINARFGINLQAGDYVDAALPPFHGQPNEKLDVLIAAHSDALVWLGTLTIKIHANDIPLNTVITNNTLNGLTWVPV